ncbi:MAG: zinc ribbon domain-containing protein [Actinomycetota bacterium]|nr:zinc ribbon domain-containing protein [Actinomycetota bacterium]
MSACPQCGSENKEEAKFCIKCGASLGAPAQAAAPLPADAPPPAPPPQAPQAAYQQPQYQQPPQYPQQAAPPAAYQQQQYAAPPAAPYPAAYATAPAARTRSSLFWVGALIVLVSGILVLVSTFMPWFLDATGWDGVTYGEGLAKLFDYGDGYPLFTGLCSLIIGVLIVMMGVLILVTRSKGLGGLAILFSIFALGMAITNLTTIVRAINFSEMQVGMYIFLIFSFLGLVGGGLSMSR